MVRAVALNFPGCEKDKNSSELISAKLVRSTLQGDRFGSKAALIEMCEDDDSQLSQGVVSHRKVSDPVGILSTRKESSKRCKVVSFSDEPVVMGYGGDQVDVDVELGKSSDSAEDEDDISEEERHTQFQTKCNTDFNSVTSNLLGKTQVLSDVVEESDKVTERSALTGRHKKFTPVVCIAPFGGGRGSARVKVNLVQPMKNGEIISDKSISNEMVEKKSSKSKCMSSDFQKVTRLDELSDVLVKDRVGSPKGESVAVKEVRKSERVSNETKVQTKLSFKIGGTHDKNHNIADSSKDQHDKISNLKTEGGSIENTSIQSVVAKDEEEVISSISITSKPNSSVSVSPSFQRIEHCNEFGCSELTKDRSPSQDKKLVVESSTTQSKVSGSDANHGDLQKIDDSKNCSPALELTESRLKSISKVENHIQTSQASASATSLHENSVGSKAAFADTRACVSALKDGSVNSSRTSFLHTMTENRDSRSSQNQDQSSLGKTEVTETKEDKVVSKNSPASTPSLSDQCQRNGSPREKPKIAAKPPGLNRLSRSFSNEEENGSSTDIRKVDLSVVPSPTVKKLSPTEHLPDYSAELADKLLDASSRLTKLVEDSAKPYLNKVNSYDQFDEQKLSRTEQIMKREKDLEKLREDLLRNHISHKPEKTSDKNSTNNAHICEVSPVPPTRCSRKVNDKSEFGGKHGQASTGMNVDKEENSENMRRGSANSNNSVRIRPSSSDGSEESSKTHELRDSALVDSESTGGATSLEQEIAKLISDSFSKPLEGVHDYSLGSPVVSPEGPSVDLFERKASLEPDDDDGADDLPPSMSMRASSVSPAQRRRGPGVRFDSGTKRASRSGGVVVEARSQSMPRADAGTRQSAGCSVGGKQLGSGKGAERRSRRDDSRRQGKFSLMKLLKFGPKEEKRKDRGRGIDGIRYKPQIIHPLDLAPAGQVEVVVRTEEEKRRDEEERERKKALLIAEGIRVYDSPNASKISRIPTPSSPSLPPHQLGYNSEGRPCPPPPPRRTSSIDPSNSAAVTSCRPPPPSVLAVSRHMGPATPGTPGTRDTQYANLGVARSDLVPSKPGRTGSLRHRSEKSSPSQDSRALQGVHELLPSADVSGPASLPLTFHHCPEDGGVTSSDAASTAATGCRKPAEQLSPSSSAPADTLEQSYEAVISSNHQALRQMLEQW